jgi:hypothetical protein
MASRTQVRGARFSLSDAQARGEDSTSCWKFREINRQLWMPAVELSTFAQLQPRNSLILHYFRALNCCQMGSSLEIRGLEGRKAAFDRGLSHFSGIKPAPEAAFGSFPQANGPV